MAIPYAVAARDLLRNSLLDGVGALLADRQWAELKMADVATAAGVSRQTLYNEFGSRDALGHAYVMREGERFLVDVERAITGRLDDPRRALAAALEVFLAAAEHDPLVRSIVLGETDGLLPLVTTRGQPVVGWAAARLTIVITDGWPQIREEQAALLAECLVRLAISYATLPHGSAADTAAAVTTLLGPYLDEVLTDS